MPATPSSTMAAAATMREETHQPVGKQDEDLIRFLDHAFGSGFVGFGSFSGAGVDTGRSRS
jgi:hypothetical protein